MVEWNLTETEWAYIAGLLDGEGVITVTKHRGRYRRSKTAQYVPKVEISNTDRKVIDWLNSRINGVVWTSSRKKGWKKLYTWRLQRQEEILDFLLNVLPYLIIKSGQAKLMIKLLTLRQPRRRKPWTKEEIEIVEEIKRLNIRGEV